jgi:hypothetical protein
LTIYLRTKLSNLVSVQELKIDRERKDITETGIYVRALDQEGRWGSHDIAQLDRESLLAWLRSRGGDNLWAENCVLLLLGHEVVDAESREL